MRITDLVKHELYTDRTNTQFRIQFTGKVFKENCMGDTVFFAEFYYYTADQQDWFKELYEGKKCTRNFETGENPYIETYKMVP